MAGKRENPSILRFPNLLETNKLLGFPTPIAMSISFFPPPKKKRNVVINHCTNLQWFNAPSNFHHQIGPGFNSGWWIFRRTRQVERGEPNANRFGQNCDLWGSMWLGGWLDPTHNDNDTFTTNLPPQGFSDLGKDSAASSQPFPGENFFGKFRGIGRGPEVHD